MTEAKPTYNLEAGIERFWDLIKTGISGDEGLRGDMPLQKAFALLANTQYRAESQAQITYLKRIRGRAIAMLQEAYQAQEFMVLGPDQADHEGYAIRAVVIEDEEEDLMCEGLDVTVKVEMVPFLNSSVLLVDIDLPFQILAQMRFGDPGEWIELRLRGVVDPYLEGGVMEQRVFLDYLRKKREFEPAYKRMRKAVEAQVQGRRLPKPVHKRKKPGLGAPNPATDPPDTGKDDRPSDS